MNKASGLQVQITAAGWVETAKFSPSFHSIFIDPFEVASTFSSSAETKQGGRVGNKKDIEADTQLTPNALVWWLHVQRNLYLDRNALTKMIVSASFIHLLPLQFLLAAKLLDTPCNL